MLLTRLYHRDIGIPSSLPQPAPGTRLGYTNHAIAAAAQDGLPRGYLPATLPTVFDLIEVEALGDRPVKWVVRFPLSDFNGWNIVLAVSWDGVVRTVWFNRSDDTHKTLDHSRYTQVGA